MIGVGIYGQQDLGDLISPFVFCVLLFLLNFKKFLGEM
jgi:hypothetical protein